MGVVVDKIKVTIDPGTILSDIAREENRLIQFWNEADKTAAYPRAYNIGVVGSGTFVDRDYFDTVMQGVRMLHYPTPVRIISGGAQGADTLAREFAEENCLECKEYLPDWDQYGKSAGMVRNAQIVKNSDEVIAFWDQKSKGTANSIFLCRKFNIPVMIFDVSDPERITKLDYLSYTNSLGHRRTFHLR